MDKEGQISGKEQEGMIGLLHSRKGNLLYFVVVLGLVCLVSAGLLSLVYAKTQPLVKAQREKEANEAMYYVLPEASSFDKAENGNYYIGKDKQGNIIGYAFKTKEKGYSSEIVLMVGVDKSLKITGIKVLSQNETPGLGTRIVEVKASSTIWDKVKGSAKSETNNIPWFLQQFIGKDRGRLIEVKTISGATISSSAVVRAVRKGLERLEKELLQEK